MMNYPLTIKKKKKGHCFEKKRGGGNMKSNSEAKTENHNLISVYQIKVNALKIFQNF